MVRIYLFANFFRASNKNEKIFLLEKIYQAQTELLYKNGIKILFLKNDNNVRIRKEFIKDSKEVVSTSFECRISSCI